MELFELVPDKSYDDGEIHARHRWGLPGVECGTCGATWGNVGIAYPTADLSRLPNSAQYEGGWPVPWNEFEERRNAVLPLLPAGSIAPPGTGLGPLVGSARGMFQAIAWQNPWTMLMRSDLLGPLTDIGLRQLVGVTTSLSGIDDLPGLVELQLEPHGRIDAAALHATVQ